MPSIDTNVLVRWLVRDEADQARSVDRLLDDAVSEPLFVPLTVLLETEWVLRSRYRFDRGSIATTLDMLLSTTELEFQQEPAIEQAIWLFKQPASPDFADCLHVGLCRHAGREPLLTFDARAAKLSGAALVR